MSGHPTTAVRAALPRGLVLVTLLLLLLSACGGDPTADDGAEPGGGGADVAVVDEPTPAQTVLPVDPGGRVGSTPGAEPAPDDPGAAAPVSPLDVGEDVAYALFDCVEDDDVACETAFEYLGGGDGLRVLAEACEDGDAFACDAFDRIVAVVGEGGGDGATEAALTDGAEDPAGEGEVLGYVVVRSDGIATTEGWWAFGDDPDVVVAAIAAEIGAPSSDSGEIPTGDGSGCPGEVHRHVGWEDRLTLTILDDTPYASGRPHLSAWQHDGGDAVFAELQGGDDMTVDVRPGFTTVAELVEAVGGDAIEVYDAPPIGPTYVVEDLGGTVLGELTDITDEGIVQTVFGGYGCGE